MTFTPAPKKYIRDIEKGRIFPELTSAQIANLTNLADNTMVYNTTTKVYQYYANSAWTTIPLTGGPVEMSGTAVILEDATYSFVVGATQIDDDGDSDHDTRFFFNKDNGATRAGTAESTQFDEANQGDNSFSIGKNNMVTGANSFAAGLANSLAAANAIACGHSNTISSSGYDSVVCGSLNQSDAANSFVGGTGNSVSSTAFDNVVVGASCISTRPYCILMGNALNSSGGYNIISGSMNTVSTQYCIVTGVRNFLDNGSGSGNGTYVQGTYNTVSGTLYGVVIGDYNRTTDATNVFVAGSYNSSASNFSLIYGSYNTVSASATLAIVFGVDNHINSPALVYGDSITVATPSYGSAIFGVGHTVSGSYAMISGGYNNVAHDYNIVSGNHIKSKYHYSTTQGVEAEKGGYGYAQVDTVPILCDITASTVGYTYSTITVANLGSGVDGAELVGEDGYSYMIEAMLLGKAGAAASQTVAMGVKIELVLTYDADAGTKWQLVHGTISYLNNARTEVADLSTALGEADDTVHFIMSNIALDPGTGGAVHYDTRWFGTAKITQLKYEI